jgi:hypothetical protein
MLKSKFDFFDVVMFVVGLIGILMILFAVGSLPKSYEANKLCNENGYKEYEWYLDGSIYCSRAGAFGKTEVTRIK